MLIFFKSPLLVASLEFLANSLYFILGLILIHYPYLIYILLYYPFLFILSIFPLDIDIEQGKVIA
jgi:hypothetical protein